MPALVAIPADWVVAPEGLVESIKSVVAPVGLAARDLEAKPVLEAKVEPEESAAAESVSETSERRHIRRLKQADHIVSAGTLRQRATDSWWHDLARGVVAYPAFVESEPEKGTRSAEVSPHRARAVTLLPERAQPAPEIVARDVSGPVVANFLHRNEEAAQVAPIRLHRVVRERPLDTKVRKEGIDLVRQAHARSLAPRGPDSPLPEDA